MWGPPHCCKLWSHAQKKQVSEHQRFIKVPFLILPIPGAGLASAVPGDDSHVAGDGHAPDDGLLVPLRPAVRHPCSRMPCLDIPDPDCVRAACGYVDPITVPGQAEDPPLLHVQHPVVVPPLPRDVEQADKLRSPHRPQPSWSPLVFSQAPGRGRFSGAAFAGAPPARADHRCTACPLPRPGSPRSHSQCGARGG